MSDLDSSPGIRDGLSQKGTMYEYIVFAGLRRSSLAASFRIPTELVESKQSYSTRTGGQ